jgi:hypothetical protein
MMTIVGKSDLYSYKNCNCSADQNSAGLFLFGYVNLQTIQTGKFYGITMAINGSSKFYYCVTDARFGRRTSERFVNRPEFFRCQENNQKGEYLAIHGAKYSASQLKSDDGRWPPYMMFLAFQINRDEDHPLTKSKSFIFHDTLA